MWQIDQNEASAAKRALPFTLQLAEARNEVQTINLGDINTADTFTLTVPAYSTFSLATTGAIAYNATPATQASNIKTAVDGLASIGSVTVANTTGANYTVTFDTGSGSATDMPLMTITPTGFTPGTITETTNGGPIGWPAKGVVLTPGTDMFISKAGGADAACAGTVTERGYGKYWYNPTAGEVDTLGRVLITILYSTTQIAYIAADVVAQASETGAPVLATGTAQAGTSTTITLHSSASSVNDFYKYAQINIRSGPGTGQNPRLIYAYNGTTKVASIEPAFAETPDATSVFDVIPSSVTAWALLRANHAITDTFGDVATVDDVADAAADVISPDGPISSENGRVFLGTTRGSA
jgi:hypothetical protein